MEDNYTENDESDSPADVDIMLALTEYLIRVCLALINRPTLDRKILSEAFDRQDSVDVFRKFISSPESSIMFVEDSTSIGGEVTVKSDVTKLHSVTSNSTAVPCMAFVKVYNTSMQSQKPIESQIQALTLSLGGDSSGDDGVRSVFTQLQQLTRHLYAPVVRAAGQNIEDNDGSTVSGEVENINSLQKKFRELDSALEQCQRGAAVPRVLISIPPAIVEPSKIASISLLKGYLDKYNGSQVDHLFKDLGIPEVAGSSPETIEEFANEINKSTKLWPAEIARQTRQVDSAFPSSAEREIDFWKDLEKKLSDTKEQLESAGVCLTKLVLKRNNRVSEQLIREAESELDRCIETVQVSVAFLRDFPIDELQSTTDLSKLSRTTTVCLQHFSKLKHSRYDFSRAVRLIEVVGSSIFARVTFLLKEKDLMNCPLGELRKVHTQAEALFVTWEVQYATQRGNLKDVAKRRKETMRSLQFDNLALQQRLCAIVAFREQHERLLNVFAMVMSGQESEASMGVNESYQLLIRSVSDAMDITEAGTRTWNAAHQMYEKRLERTEEKITRLLEDRLGAAQTAEEMFRVFSTFNPLFFRPAIRNAVNSFRAALVKNVREDVRRLQDKFRLRYEDSLERATADLRDIPPLSGTIIWARQIENQLTTLMKRLEDVLGLGWEDHFEGKQLKEVCDELHSYLDTDQLYKDWLQLQLRADTQKYSKLKEFLLLVVEDPRTGKKILQVNFDDKQVVVFKEVRYLEWLLPGMSTTHKVIPSTLLSMSREAYARYPVATALQAALAGFAQAKSGITPDNSVLLTSHVQAVRDIVKEAIGGSKRTKRWIKWDSASDLNDWVGQFSSKVYALQEKVDDVTERMVHVENYLHQLRTCPYVYTSLEEIMNQLQAMVDEVQIRGFSNVASWVSGLDIRIELIILERLKTAVRLWVRAFSSDSLTVDETDNAVEDSPLKGRQKSISSAMKRRRPSTIMKGEKEKKETAQEERMTLDPTLHEVLLSNQILFVAPPLEQARVDWITAFHEHLSVVCTLPRISSSRFNVFAGATNGPCDYSSTLFMMDQNVLSEPFIIMEEKILQAKEYAQQWLQYQALWDASSAVLVEKMGRDIRKWQQLLSEIKNARTTIDSTTEEISFGPIIVNHRQVQNKVNLKYDTWQKESQLRFGTILLEELKNTQSDIVGCKSKLESISLQGSTKEVIIGVECILKTKSSLTALKHLVGDLESSEKLLQKQRYQFPSDWLSVSNVVGSLADLCQILDRRITSMDAQLPSLQLKIRDEDTANTTRTQDLLNSWETERPAIGGLLPNTVLQTLSMFATQVTKLTEDAARVNGAKDALGLDFLSDDRLSFVAKEIADLKEVWHLAAPIYERLNAMKGTLLRGDFNPTKIRKELEEIGDDLKNLPAKTRSYAAIEWAQETLLKRQSIQPILRDLSTEALKDRHWKTLLHAMGLSPTYTSHDLTLGALWESDPLTHRKVIQEVLSTAQGELALEQFLKDLREHWVSCELNLALRDGVRLIVEWDVLFSSLEDNLNSLASLKQSPYFRNVPEFQEDTVSWETRLTNLRAIFDIWVEVQRKWVYLRGIFRNPDIKAQLPAQFSKFKSVDNEFLSLMKRVALKPSVVDLLQIDNLARQLERQDSAMTLIQKALGEYLERQRQIFPRFYFVNNDDLVEIIGNSSEPTKIVSHLGKMFAAITSINMSGGDGGDYSEQNMLSSPPSGTNTMTPSSPVPKGDTTAHAMCSKEGEVVPFVQTVDLTAGVKSWLSALEIQMAVTLEALLEQAVAEMLPSSTNIQDDLLAWIGKFPAQIVVLSSQLSWSQSSEQALTTDSSGNGKGNGESIALVVTSLENRLKALSKIVLQDLESPLRKKCEQLLTEMVHQRDVARLLAANKVTGKSDFNWLYHLRFYWTPKEADRMQRLSIKMSSASFYYGFEYQGIGERLVQTPLTDRCYLTLTQALHFRMGANPFGPAGTGKTETVKMLGAQLGRFVLVFNCDSSFDYAAMGRIFAGLCQVGAWGCLDEFNRLEERILSAVSQQILAIQRGLLLHQDTIELLGNPCKLRKEVGIFVTMNPGYAGRSNLPDNLKQLFRAVAMVVPDRNMIAQVMLFSQGIATAEELAGKIVLLFTLCQEQLSAQSHYDFGLRALKSVLVGAGDLKRAAISASGRAGGVTDADDMRLAERDVLIKSACDSVVPKLVSEDIPIFTSLLQAVFPGSELPKSNDKLLLAAVAAVCEEDSLELCPGWTDKILQLKQVLDMRHGVMMVGPSNTGKTTAWRTLLKALGRVDGAKGDFYVIDPKSIKKEKLYGSLDPNTLEWTDGVFTKLLRKVSEGASLRGGMRRSWIVFDGDVDPEWAENLNSVLDDNKVLTLPSGDRLKIPNNVRIMMEVDSLQHATMATVSRCGMVWFAEDTVPVDALFRQQLRALRAHTVQLTEAGGFDSSSSSFMSSALQQKTQTQFVDAIAPHFTTIGLVGVALEASFAQVHIMEPSVGRFTGTLFSLLVRGIALALDYNEGNSDFPMSDSHIELFAVKWLLHSLLWSFGGSMSSEKRADLGDLLLAHSTLSDQMPSGKNKPRLIDLQVNVADGGWTEWSAAVAKVEIESHRVPSSDVIITTTDTVRHVEVLRAWLSSHKPLILCGPPGSGKTMTLNAILESVPEYVLAPLNFSSATTPDLILKTFAQYCEVVDSPDGLIMLPQRASYREIQWLVVFCDEINLPEADLYGSQGVIMFLRQLTEQGGFWNADCKWVSLRRIQFVGACNPPTDAGRVALSPRFLRHAPLLLVDYPSETSLKQIYWCFNHALLKLHPNLRGSVEALNNAMVDFYRKNQTRFTAEIAPQYIYSPRELSRWVRAMYEAMEPAESMTLEDLVRLWAHEALRLFHDRLISADEREWCDSMVDEVAQAHFPGIEIAQCLRRPLLYSNWLNRTYQSTPREKLRSFVAARLKVFYEEELDVPLVIFDDVLEHVLRIDNVLRHPMGHLLLVGDSGVGKTVLSRFVSWMNGLTVFQIKANSKYSVEQFDEDLRGLLRRVGVEGEKICFIFDEGNALSSAFLERMNALLASGEIPGLFEGDERLQLMSACRDNYSQRDGLMTDSEDDLWRTFTKFVQRNLHVVFTMNPASSDFSNRCTASPALFNRCVVDWFGTWGQSALAQVGSEFTMQLDTGFTTYAPPKMLKALPEGRDADGATEILSMTCHVLNTTTVTLREAVVAALVTVYQSVKALCVKLGKSTGRQHYLSPRDFLDSIKKFISTENEKRTFLAEQQTHIRMGLLKLLETQDQVGVLRGEMVLKDAVLQEKDAEANSKLSQMVGKQSEAEQRKKLAEELTVELSRQNEDIRVRREQVEVELSEAEPALVSAKQSVQNIRKAQLDEVRALGRPPNAVRLTMEMVSIMIGEMSTDWQDIRRVIRRDDFIATVVNFDPLSLTQKQVKAVQDDYLSNAELDYTSVDRASKACGPLYQWAESQIQYATILRKVKPLRDEVTALIEKSDILAVQQKEAVGQVGDLEGSIQQYKSEYATAIRDSETIRAERDIVDKKVGRAEALLKSLEQEKDRWQSTSAAFDAQMSTLIGDSLLAGSFLTYAGGFDHRARKHLMAEWADSLHCLNIPFRVELEIVPYLSSPMDQMRWRSCGLPADELAVQNAILLERFDRYPLIIDPSGQATSFILNKYADQKIVQTSFLDAAFLKTLASAIRFGSPLLVQDVESIDPILNPVLNKELQKTGGRTLIRLGTEDIDFSPKFMIFLTTRNPFAVFAPDLCSRVTLVNFTVTPASLESQALSAILKAERPDVDARRTELLRLQGAQSVKLRDLEEKLLNKISAVQGAILDDDSVINSMEIIQAEAAALNKEVSKTVEVMEEVKAISSSYEPLAVAVASVYFSLEGLSDIYFLYQFSLRFFLEILDKVLSSKDGGAVQGAAPASDAVGVIRLQVLSDAFYNEVSRRVLRSLRSDDKMMFVVRLAQIATQDQSLNELTDTEADFLFRGSVPSNAVETPAILEKFKNALPGSPPFDIAVARQLVSLSSLPIFSSLYTSMNEKDSKLWEAFFEHTEPESVVPMGWISASANTVTTPERLALLKVILVRCLRPERTLNALESFVYSVFGQGFEWRAHSNLDLRHMVETDSRCNTPLMFCSEAGQDASAKVDALAVSLNRSILSVAMGSAEGYTEADRSVAQAAKSGGWVLLRNVHLCAEWLTALEKRLHGLTPHDSFRLFLTCEISTLLPSSLLRMSEVVVVEASTGIKAKMQRFFGSIPAARADKVPAERCRLYGLLSWFNAVVHERLRYTPLGWTKKYEFNESDAACALDVIDQWVDGVAGSRGHVSPEELPWQALKTLLSQSLYGGRVDHPFDQAALDSFIDSTFSPSNYSAGACLARDVDGNPLVTLPDAFGRQAFETWMRALPDAHSPAWLGLPVQAESQLKSFIGQRALSTLAQLQGVESANTASASDKNALQTRNRAALEAAARWLAALPTPANMASLAPEGSEPASLSSLQRCLLREVGKGRSALSLVRKDLETIKSHCEGDTKATNSLRKLMTSLSSGIVPSSWRAEYPSPTDTGISSWVADLVSRSEALDRYRPMFRTTEAVSGTRYWMGGMFNPHSFITATRQHSAQSNKWSLEDLELYLEIGFDTAEGVQDVVVEGLVLEGARSLPSTTPSSSSSLQLCEELRTNLPPSRLRWRLKGDKPAYVCTAFPLYLNTSRAELVTEIIVRTDESAHVLPCIWAQRGVAFIIQSPQL